MHQSSSAAAIRGVCLGLRLLGGSRPLSSWGAAASPGVRQVVLDFNEVRLVGRVAKVLDMGANSATFVLTTQHSVRPRTGASQGAADAAADDTPVVASRTERFSHLVVGRIGGDRDDQGGEGSAWQQYLYPGSRVEITGQLTYRAVRGPPAGTDDAAGTAAAAPIAADSPPPRIFEPLIRLIGLSPIGDVNTASGDAYATDGGFDHGRGQQRWDQQQQQQQQPRRRGPQGQWDQGDLDAEGTRY